MNRTEAYMELLEAIQNYIQTAHSPEHYARDWLLITGVEPISGTQTCEVRIDHSPNSATWSIYGLLTLGIENFTTD